MRLLAEVNDLVVAGPHAMIKSKDHEIPAWGIMHTQRREEGETDVSLRYHDDPLYIMIEKISQDAAGDYRIEWTGGDGIDYSAFARDCYSIGHNKMPLVEMV
jgi:hypothetical protein